MLKESPSTASHPSHFKGKDAARHVAEAQALGALDAKEIHGTEAPGFISAGTDAARDTFVLIASLFILFPSSSLSFLSAFILGWAFWKAGRSAWINWSRLERLNRVLKEEKWEIDHHRHQEREELKVLYEAKGFQGKLLDDVLDVLMADSDRLLKVMIEEELGLTLESQEHPLKQALAAFLGVFLAGFFSVISFWLFGTWGLNFLALLGISISSLLYSSLSGNQPIPACIWNLALFALSLGTTYFLGQFFS